MLNSLAKTGLGDKVRYILHCDLNNFYASVECHENPELRGKAVVVCGKVEDRHGVVLAKNYIAKECGIKTGDVLWEARQKCPNLISVEARHELYIKYSRLVRAIYSEYTDRIEPFGIDEAWLDLTGSVHSFSEAEEVANTLRKRVKSEVGLTISVGVSFCKVFAKLGSDMKKPDATTTITPENFREKVWPLPVSDLLYVGRATARRLADLNITTIGDLANFNDALINSKLGKVGLMLLEYARGQECGEVRRYNERAEIKSVGNSLTYYKDISSKDDIYALFLILSESVVARMAKYGFSKARTLSISVTDNNLKSLVRMAKLNPPTNIATDIAAKAFELFEKNFNYSSKVRALGLHLSEWVENEQVSWFETLKSKQKKEKLQKVVESLRTRFGRNSVQRAIVMRDPKMKEMDIISDHSVSPTMFDSLEKQRRDKDDLLV